MEGRLSGAVVDIDSSEAVIQIPVTLFSCNQSNHTPRHLWVYPTNAIRANNEIGWIENVALDEFKHFSINPLACPYWVIQFEC
jgi:hypothetical protein